MDDKSERWNRFIFEIAYSALDNGMGSLSSKIQKNAVLCFWYDTEMNSNGHSGYFDWYPDTIPEEMVYAIETIANQTIAANYLRAVSASSDDYTEMDKAYYDFKPSLSDYLEEYIENNRDIIFR